MEYVPTGEPKVEAAGREVPDPHVRFVDVCMAFGTRTVFEHLSCSFPRRQISVILGGSGSGKTTLLRLIGGLVRPRSGSIFVDGEDVTRLSERELYRVRKKIGMLFQGGALLDSFTVFENVAFPLREHTRLGEDEIRKQVHECLEEVGLRDVDDLLPSQLSGGMVKRVALARAMIMKPVLLLCDEPFSGLDPVTSRRIEALLVETNRRHGITMIVVSHSIMSTMRIAKRVLLLLPDRAIEGTPADLAKSRDPVVSNFLNENTSDALVWQEALETERAALGRE
ncbi:MAG: ABC transporter ATP-binding protein [Candidatus Binatia bacterium]|nr:MAG: ABC transporter ATP-binding protein [Candidatus Binatia bacterium]